MSRRAKVPALAAALLARALPAEHRDGILAELESEYREHVVISRGRLRARLWYWRQALGSIVWQRRHGERRAAAFLDRLAQDVRFALRAFARAPAFAALSILTLALGVGVSTTVFSVLNGVVLRPLPYPDAHELVRLWNDWNLSKAVTGELAERAEGFQALHGRMTARETLTGRGEPTELYGAEITPGYLSMFGAAPLHGRFPNVDETAPGQSDVVVLSEAAWRRLFAGDTAAIGSTIELGGIDTTVIGIVPASFRPLVGTAEFWKPITIDPDDFSDYQGVAQLSVFGRLDPDASAGASTASVLAYANEMHERSPRAFGDSWVAAAAPIPLHTALVSTNRTTLWTVMGAAGFLLLTACANVANLLLARSGQRHREIAIRIGMGASAGRLTRQLLTESLVLGAAGGGLGLVLAATLQSWITVALPPGLPLAQSVALDGRVLGFALSATFATSLLFGVGPALRAARVDPQRFLREAAPSVSRGREGARMNRVIVAAEIALAVVLAIGAGLMLRSLQQLNAVDTGIAAEGVTTMRVRLPENSAYSGGPDRAAMFGRITERLAAVPGVRTVGAGAFLPMQSGLITAVYRAEGVDYPEDQPPPNAAFQLVLAGYFESLGIPLLAGRPIGPQDTAGAPVVGVVNRSFAEEAFGGVADAIGKQVNMFGGTDFEVVGVVADSLQQEPGKAAWAEAFFHYRQVPWWPSMYLLVRSDPDAMASAESLRTAIWEIDPQVPVLEIRPMEAVVRSSTARPRYLALLLSGFGIVALALGAIGVYGLMSFAVADRTYEFGIRAALGASRGRILRQAVGDALLPSVIGVLAGGALAATMTRVMQGMLFGVEPLDPLTFAVAPTVLLGVAILASYLPARRAAAVDPRRLMSPE